MNPITNRREELSFFDPFFDAFFGENYQNKNYGVLPMKTDIKENEKGYELAIEIPGFDKKDISLKLESGYLTVTAKVNRVEEEKGKNGRFLHRERFSGVSSRSYYVGDVEQKDIKAAYKDGVLAITFPKENPEEKEAKCSIAID
ncbi:MAG: Hsp20/alpha crystallin family protein [Bacilli bacterium]|nr:Hsp20/alpha crystallin family protein [Bacilli bacterium]